ncbi:MAG: acyltransferase family protein [Rhodospirillales bacterium]|nr:acyltransferase family protein [Rhodospirillales bacterium]
MTSQRISYFDIAKGIGILWVVFYHSMLFLQSYDEALVWGRYEKVINFAFPFAMPLFFVISGYLSQKALGGVWRDFINKRILPLLYLFGLWSLIRWIYFACFQDNILNETEGQTPLQLLTLWIAPTGTLWFIWSLAIFFLISRLLINIPAFIPLSISLIISILTYADIITFETFAYRTLALYLPFVLIGAHAKKQYLDVFDKTYVAVGLTALASYLLLYILRMHLDGILLGVVQFALAGIGIIWTLSLSKGLEHWSVARRILIYFGENTLPIYVAHTLFVSAVSAVTVWLGSLSDFSYLPLIALPVTGSTALIMALLIQYFSRQIRADWLYNKPSWIKLPTAT